MRERGVQIESWGPFAEGKNDLFTNPTLGEIGGAHGKSVAQVVLRWLIQRDVVVIPKSVRPERMAQNLDVFDFDLTDEEMARIAALDTGAIAVLRPPRPRDGRAGSADAGSTEHLRTGAAPQLSAVLVPPAGAEAHRPQGLNPPLQAVLGGRAPQAGTPAAKESGHPLIRTGIRGDPSCRFSDKAGTSAGLRPGNSPALYRAAGADNETAHGETKDMSHA